MNLIECLEQFAHRGALDRDDLCAFCQVSALRRTPNLRHVQTFSREDRIALSTWPGAMGSFRMRTPTASKIALAMAAGGGTIGTSPTPRTPYGCPGFGTSTITVSIMGKSRAVGMR